MWLLVISLGFLLILYFQSLEIKNAKYYTHPYVFNKDDICAIYFHPVNSKCYFELIYLYLFNSIL